ncbi:hypothetical protein TWF506_003043 [Arthrobotrys conoides]|uniref:Uncharacterized protein n=1 Tax=Arthrobotrys conoides TaxID=74498 RepID=A0AAN8N4F9_9PEZI
MANSPPSGFQIWGLRRKLNQLVWKFVKRNHRNPIFPIREGSDSYNRTTSSEDAWNELVEDIPGTAWWSNAFGERPTPQPASRPFDRVMLTEPSSALSLNPAKRIGIIGGSTGFVDFDLDYAGACPETSRRVSTLLPERPCRDHTKESLAIGSQNNLQRSNPIKFDLVLVPDLGL